MAPARSTNKRRDTRIEASIPVVLHRGRAKVRLVTVDVSYRGLFVETGAEKPADIRALVKLHVELPTGGFDAHAMVVHVDERPGRVGMGLQFWALSGTERRTWESYVRTVLDAQRAVAKSLASGTVPIGPDSQVSGIRSVAPESTPAPGPAVKDDPQGAQGTSTTRR